MDGIGDGKELMGSINMLREMGMSDEEINEVLERSKSNGNDKKHI